MTPKVEKLFLSPPEVAKLLGCSDVTVRRMIRSGELRAEHRGRNFKVPRSEVLRLAGSVVQDDDTEERRALVRKARTLMAELGVVLAQLEA